eukprot:COSAG05_NODE_12226_length_476_cov_31.795756_2_plen_26_part_01
MLQRLFSPRVMTKGRARADSIHVPVQ